MRKWDCHLGEEHSSGNTKCKGPEVGMHPAVQNKDAFVAGVECVKGRRGDDFGAVTADQLVESKPCRSSTPLSFYSWVRWEAVGRFRTEEYAHCACVLVRSAWPLYSEGTAGEQGQSRASSSYLRNPDAVWEWPLRMVNSGWILDDETCQQDVRWEKLK